MAFSFDGYVLRGTRVSPSNSSSATEPDSGVLRDLRPEATTAAAPTVVDLHGDQYRTVFLSHPAGDDTEYLVWAANTSSLTLVNDPNWIIDQGTGSIPVGTTAVGNYTDGSVRAVVTDNGGREMAQVWALTIARGDQTYDDQGWDPANPYTARLGATPYLVYNPLGGDQNAAAGTVDLTAILPALDGGLSRSRGDRIVSVLYTLNAATFWWTRNDQFDTRFGWDGRTQRWKPYRGSAPKNQGELKFDTDYVLSPKPNNLVLNTYLPGDAGDWDEYAMLRLGGAGAGSKPLVNDGIFDGIQVVLDQDVAGFDFTLPPHDTLSGVVGEKTGALRFNPAFVSQYAGLDIWYSFKGFRADGDGLVGDLRGADLTPLYLAPLPGPTDHPFIRLGNRTPLTPILVPDEASLGVPAEGEVQVALSTGRIRLSQADVDKADPAAAGFSKFFLGEQVFYDGVALNAIPQPTRAPVKVLGDTGVPASVTATNSLYLPDSTEFPSDTELLAPYLPSSPVYVGLGSSGIINAPDGTGALAQAGSIPVRVGGDTLPLSGAAPMARGAVRRVDTGLGDMILFSKNGAIVKSQVVNYAAEVPSSPHDVPGETVVFSQERLTNGALLQLNAADRTRFAGDEAYFLQAILTPATYTIQAQLVSRNPEPFVFRGTEKLYYSRNGVPSTWTAPAGSFTAAQVAASIGASASALGDRVVLSGSTTVEIGWGTIKDLSAAAVLGFLPGWRAKVGQGNWLPDSGVSLGLYRNALNLDRSRSDADYSARARLVDVTLQSSVPASPFVFLDRPPLQDVAGYDEGVFFNLRTTVVQNGQVQIVDRPLQHFVDVQYQFGQGKFSWLESASVTQVVQNATTVLPLGNTAVVTESLLGAPGIGGGLAVAADGGRFVQQVQDTDYLLPQDGQVGIAQLVNTYGAGVLTGARGTYTSGGTVFTVTDDVDFTVGVAPGYRLKVGTQSYLVQSIPDATHLVVTPTFPESTTRPTPWSLFHGIDTAAYDPSVVADQVYQSFSHLPSETFKVRVLSPLGTIPASSFRADMGETLSMGRPIDIRFGASVGGATTSATLMALARMSLGTLANGVLFVPAGTHFGLAKFSVRIGTDLFTQALGGGLVGVAVFSPNPGGGNGVEYLTTTGELKFGTGLLADLAATLVWYIEELLDGADILTGTAEYNPETGEIRLSEADQTTHDAKMAYFVEQMITAGQQDVAISPLAGSVSFRKPLVVGQLVEFEYWLADGEGRRVGSPTDYTVEFLPVFVQRETATRISPRQFLLNPSGTHVIDQTIDPIVSIGPMQQNFGASDFLVDYPADYPGALRLTFNRDMASWVTVVGTYAVFDALGGEKAYNASQRPIYRPPFYIPAASDHFDLRGSRPDLVAGQVLRLGSDHYYIRGTTYFATQDATRVYIFPPTPAGREAGSRSPGNDTLCLITKNPVTTVVDPDGSSPVATTAVAGFMSALSLTSFPFEKVTPDQNYILFQGDLTRFAVPGHVLEVAGRPYAITGADLSDDGTRTKISLSSPFQAAVDPASSPTVKLSYRPLYPPDVRQFLGVGPLLADQGVEVVLFGEMIGTVEQPGRSLLPSIEYEIDASTGVIKLLNPMQGALVPGQRLMAYFTQLRALSPFLRNQEIVFPRYKADYLYGTSPSADNGLLGATLTATYTFESPDSYYCRIMPLEEFIGDVATEAAAAVEAQEPTSGPTVAVVPSTDNWAQGRIGIKAERRNLLDNDRAGRLYLDFYNQGIEGFEQTLESIDGCYIGDRDGKFRFFVGRGVDQPPPGFEDDLTGYLNPYNVWGRVFGSHDPVRDIWFNNVLDPLVTPTSAYMTPGDLGHIQGTPLSPGTLGYYLAEQRAFTRNDVDDIILVGPGRSTVRFQATAPFYMPIRYGTFSTMGQPGRLSRLFPETARVFCSLMPGAMADVANNDPGVYTYGRTNPDTGAMESTFNQPIGSVSNPVLGVVGNLSEKNLRQRLARTRVWGYFPQGLAQDTLAVGVPAANITVPCLIVSSVPLSELPINPDTGYPDTSWFLSQGGTLPDAEAGDPARSLPGFSQGEQVGLGKPDGRLLPLYSRELVDVYGTTGLTGVFIQQVQYGCILTFQDSTGAPITDPNNLLVGTAPSSGTPWALYPVEQSDTLLSVPPTAVATAPVADPSTDAATVAVLQQAATMSPAYRSGLDFLIQANGTILDRTMPSFSDPAFFGLKELLGQNPPNPMSHLEGTVDFTYTEAEPLEIPALKGETTDDSGDNQVPYLKAGNTELDRLGSVHNEFGGVIETDPVRGALYPDEILTKDGQVLLTPVPLGGGFWKEPATLLSQTDFLPASAVGIEPVRPWDLLFSQVNPSAEAGYQGILTVGDVVTGGGWSHIEPPRFVTPTTPPQAGSDTQSPVQYGLENYAVITTPGVYPTHPQASVPLLSGVRLVQDTSVVPNRLILSFQSCVANGIPFTLNDGQTSWTGNLNSILAAGDNLIRIQIIGRHDDDITFVPAPTSGDILLTIDIYNDRVKFYNPAGYAPATFTQAYAGVGPSGRPYEFGTFTGVVPGEAVPGSVTDERHIVLYGVALALPFPMVPGSNPNWIIPFTDTGVGQKVGIYPYECAISVYTFNSVSANPAISPVLVAPKSNTAWCSDDRLTFNEVLDFRQSRVRGYQHPDATGSQVVYETKLKLEGITVNGTLNTALPSSYNGGTPFTFQARQTSALGLLTGSSSWAGVVGLNPERGWLKVMGWEGDGNAPISVTGQTFSVAASNDYSPALLGAGNGRAQYNFIVPEDPADVGVVKPGDVVVIDKAATLLMPDLATPKVGSYLLRYALSQTADSTPAPPPWPDGWIYRSYTVQAQTAAFPTVLSASFSAGPTGAILVTTNPLINAPPGRVFVVVNLAGLDSPDASVFQRAVFSADYNTLNVLPTGYQFASLVNITWADGTLATLAELQALSLVGKQVSWLDATSRFPLEFVLRGGVLPNDSSVVGWHNAVPAPGMPVAYHGCCYLTLRVPHAGGNADLTFTAGTDLVDVAPAVGEVQVIPGALHDPTTFDPTGEEAVYDHVPRQAFFRLNAALPTVQALNNPQGHAVVGSWIHRAVLPHHQVWLMDPAGPTAGFLAQTGLFVEPSLPQMVTDLGGVTPHVVDATHTYPYVGMRDLATVEGVHFSVRRIRRFHEVQTNITTALAPLRFAYEIRRGTVTAYSTSNQQFGILTASAGTNLGDFNDPDVNINPGDVVRVLDTDGSVLDEAFVSAVSSATVLRLMAPGLVKTSPVGKTFQVFLRTAPVPHEQSFEQLVELFTEEVWRTQADRSDPDPTQWKGGYVPTFSGTWTGSANLLYDDSAVPPDYTVQGIQKGDFVVIDAAGDCGVTVGHEKGTRPFGDLGTEDRTQFASGAPGPLDDNRGFYRVTKVEADHLTVTGASLFTGDLNSDVLMAASDAALQYAVYPTINDSGLSDIVSTVGTFREGQNDLRPTKLARLGSYLDPADPAFEAHSIRPFSYRVLRPVSLVSLELIETVLAMRERMLSFIEFLQTALTGGGTFWDFQQREHLQDLGDPTLPESGLGLLTNRYITEILGNLSVAPFLNTRGCLSLLDRRFWITDRRLDSLGPVAGGAFHYGTPTGAFPTVTGPYTAYTDVQGMNVRPLYQDFVSLALDKRDQLRAMRLVWLAYRTNQVGGTLARIRRFDTELPKRLKEKQRVLLLRKTTGN